MILGPLFQGACFFRIFLEVKKITVKCSSCRFRCEHLSTFYQPKAGKQTQQPNHQKSKNPKKKKGGGKSKNRMINPLNNNRLYIYTLITPMSFFVIIKFYASQISYQTGGFSHFPTYFPHVFPSKNFFDD